MVNFLPAVPEQILHLGIAICIVAGVFGLLSLIVLRLLKIRLDKALDRDYGEVK